MNKQVIKYKWKDVKLCNARDDVNYKNNLHFKKECLHLKILYIYKEGFPRSDLGMCNLY